MGLGWARSNVISAGNEKSSYLVILKCLPPLPYILLPCSTYTRCFYFFHQEEGSASSASMWWDENVYVFHAQTLSILAYWFYLLTSMDRRVWCGALYLLGR